ncbi:patatin-like phospholipase family protein, partial [bacterium]|nr:patatin-like phospholipase family protein [bacterium]
FLCKCVSYLPGAVLNFMTALPSTKSELRDAFMDFIKQPSATSYDKLMQRFTEMSSKSGSVPSWFHILPSGVFDNAPIERYVRENIKKNNLTNSFVDAKKISGKSLYIIAMTLDGAKRVIFGPDEVNDIEISQAIQASTAMPGFYKPARINGVDYVDGGVHQTANIDVAIEKGAKLIICYNPFRPFDKDMFQEYLQKERRYVSQDQRLSDNGVMAVLNQIFRTFFYTRLHFAIEQYENNPNFDGDIILIEPKADDVAFFELNPLAFGNRQRAAQLGFESVRKSINEKYEVISKILDSYGIKTDKQCVEEEHVEMEKFGKGDRRVMEVLKKRKKKSNQQKSKPTAKSPKH